MFSWHPSMECKMDGRERFEERKEEERKSGRSDKKSKNETESCYELCWVFGKISFYLFLGGRSVLEEKKCYCILGWLMVNASKS